MMKSRPDHEAIGTGPSERHNGGTRKMSIESTTDEAALVAAHCADVESLMVAARDLLNHGGSIVRRNALRKALNKIGNAGASQATPHPEVPWQITPSVKWVLSRAAKRASMDQDEWIRTEHLKAALEDLPNADSARTR